MNYDLPIVKGTMATCKIVVCSFSVSVLFTASSQTIFNLKMQI